MRKRQSERHTHRERNKQITKKKVGETERNSNKEREGGKRDKICRKRERERE